MRSPPASCSEPRKDPMDIEQVVARAAAASRPFAQTAPRERAAALVAAADALDANAGELIDIAMRETGLGEPRLVGELRRTSNQLRLFAEVIVDGAYLDARIDDADPDYVIGPRPDVRRVLQPVGPVLNFAASNFPFAFSVAGGDSAAALAAGCPVIVKAHSGHPELSARTAGIVAGALAGAGLPDGVFQLISGQAHGVEALRDDRIRAAAFTGSTHIGTMLARIAAERPRPIPFYGELGSVNPVYVTAGAAAREQDLAAGFLGSVTGSAGQLCTKPGFLFVPAGTELDLEAAAAVAEHRLLTPGIGDAFARRRDEVSETDGVTVLSQGTVRVDDAGHANVTPVIARTDLATLLAERDRLLEESFGPLAIVVEYPDAAALPAIHRELFPGNLTSTVHAAAGDDIDALVEALAETSGRVLFGGWPTGVSVTSAMQHGGPFPATTTDATSVGTAAITRFLRGVAYQGAPQELLPPPLRDDNPWGVPQRRSPAGLSQKWGALTGAH
ncbi:aldehyde dehydrogenase (NADP(+)) [Microbacterium candidum]|uniref:Aldehyde dehydrogenase (NADP(+)) n=1 Tax=Microbacterium candidum TaxID=3041922 RepID=A0ABT7MZW6_9MICO|nr:aldehyde dehydrogenase (NADP(+)) [Microbacterium sp. ASV49]MDL9979982.1 aldehyde dehydrogenase (NADP(+)) [Microbacterium sp. ASV49]